MSSSKVYVPARSSRTELHAVRGLSYRFRHWGPHDGNVLLCLHGHRDCAATFQFLIDALRQDWRVVAPDWRGHGGSGWAQQGYYYHDYLADLDVIIDLVSPDRPVAVLGHSLGGNIACVYAGLRPERVSRVASIDGFGLKGRLAADAPDHLRGWLDSWRKEPVPRIYGTTEAMAERLRAANKRLTVEKSLFLAREMAREVDGGFTWSFDPAHQRPFSALYRIDEWAACWTRVMAPVLWIAAGDRFERLARVGPEGFDWRMSHFRNGSNVQIAGTGHNIHHDAPDELARVVEAFFAV
jgi:pimeloyl-ACP methyl ester carboxylesterase